MSEMDEEIILTMEQKRRKMIIPFYGAVGATADSILCGDKVGYHYKITKIEIHFRDDTANQLQVSVYVGTGRQVITDTPPEGTNILANFTPTPYVVGQGQTIIINCNYIPEYREVFLKVYLNNLNAYALTGMVLITIESLTLRDIEELAEESKFKITANTPEEYFKELNSKGNALFTQTIDTLKGTPPWLKYKVLTGMIEDNKENTVMKLGGVTLSNPFNFIKTDETDEGKAEKFKDWWRDCDNLVRTYHGSNALIEIMSLGQLDFQRDWIETDKQIWRVIANMGKVSDLAFDTAWLPALQRIANKTWLPTRPDTAQLINMVVKEKLKLDEYTNEMFNQGFNSYWSGKIWDAHFRAPDFTEVRQAIWREGITHDEIPAFLKRVDLDPFYNEKVWYKLLEQIPPYTDLINMRVKEVLTQEDFKKAIQTHGFYDPWAKYLWDAHFAPPTFMDFLTAFRRKQAVTIPKADGTTRTHTFGIDLAEDIKTINELSILADYDPRYWDFFKTRIYEDPTPRQARWGYEAGALTPKQVYDITKRHGFRDEDAKWFTDFTLKFQERPLITRYINALMTAYLNETIDAKELEKRIVAIPRRKAIAEWILKIADVRKEILAKKPEKVKEKLLSVSELKRMFSLELIEEDDLRTRMLLLGYDVIDIQLLIDLTQKLKEETESGAQKRALTVSEMFNAYKWWQITEEELKTNLMLRGLTLQEADLLINTKKKQWVTKEKWTETEIA